MIKHIAAIAVILTAGYASAATPNAKYELKRIPMGPRADQYVLVRVERADQAERPYALTGERDDRRAERPAVWPTPTHLKGTHGQY